MNKPSINISSELSAQGFHAPVNPKLRKSLDVICNNPLYKMSKPLKVADLGCGRLRHLSLFLEYCFELYLVDTKLQIQNQHLLGDQKQTIENYIRSIKVPNKKIVVLPFEDFEKKEENLDAIFSIAVFDVVLLHDRTRMIKAAFSNLKKNGMFILIIPRNDVTITRRFTSINKYEDGHIFKRSIKSHTFMKNFKDTNEISSLVQDNGFTFFEDHSDYHQLCLFFKK
jgi:hypothetical protein